MHQQPVLPHQQSPGKGAEETLVTERSSLCRPGELCMAEKGSSRPLYVSRMAPLRHVCALARHGESSSRHLLPQESLWARATLKRLTLI